MMEPGRQVDDTEGLEEEPWTTTTDGRHCDETAVGMATNDGGLKKGPWTPTEDAILMYYVKNHGEGNWNAVQRNSGLARCGKSCRLRWTNHLRPDLKKGPLSPEEEQTILRLHQRFGNKWARMTDYLPGRTDNEIKNYWNTRKKRLQRAKLPLYPLEIQQHCEDNPINHPIPPSLSTTFTPFRAMVADNSSLPPLFTAAAANNSSLAAVVDNSSLPLLFEAAAAANTSFLPPVLEAAAVDINSSLPFLNHDDYLFAESLIVLYDQRKEQQKMKSLDNPFAEQQQMGLTMENYRAEPIHDLPPYLSSKMELPSAQLFSEIHDGQLLDTLLNEAQYSGETLQKEEVLPGLIIESYDEKPLQLRGETLLNEEMMMTTMMPALVIKSYGEATLPKEEMLPGFRSYDDKPLQPCEYGDMHGRWLSTT